MDKLFGKTLKELQQIVAEHNLPSFTAMQIADWLYKKGVDRIDLMSNLSKKVRNSLSESFVVGLEAPLQVLISKDETRKYLFKVKNGFIETAMIPDRERKTICISSQEGCKMSCAFCMTGKQGFQSNLSSNEIMNQFRMIEESLELTNIVYMGMGEPLDNWGEVKKSIEIITSSWGYSWSPRRITVSSIGIKEKLIQLLNETECNIAISLHSPFPEERLKIMPIEKVNPIQEIISELKKYDFSGQRRISFEYILLKEINDTTKHAKELVKLLNGLKCRVNLIKFHQIPDVNLLPTPEEGIENFKNELNKMGLFTTLRSSRGEDIFAACGLLSSKKTNP